MKLHTLTTFWKRIKTFEPGERWLTGKVMIVCKLFHVNPAMSASTERTFSMARCLKTRSGLNNFSWGTLKPPNLLALIAVQPPSLKQLHGPWDFCCEWEKYGTLDFIFVALFMLSEGFILSNVFILKEGSVGISFVVEQVPYISWPLLYKYVPDKKPV